MNQLLIGNDQTIQLLGLYDEEEAVFINDATVTARVKLRNDDETEGDTWPITLNYVAASDGDYVGNIENTVELVNRRSYLVEVKAVQGDFQALWQEQIPAVYRRFGG